MLRSTWRGLKTWHGRDAVTLADERARDSGTQTLPMSEMWKLRHRQTKEAETDMLNLPPPRHVSTLPFFVGGS
jgi:hypothetical protein